MLWKWRNDRRSERNLCNCVKKPELMLCSIYTICFIIPEKPEKGEDN